MHGRKPSCDPLCPACLVSLNKINMIIVASSVTCSIFVIIFVIFYIAKNCFLICMTDIIFTGLVGCKTLLRFSEKSGGRGAVLNMTARNAWCLYWQLGVWSVVIIWEEAEKQPSAYLTSVACHQPCNCNAATFDLTPTLASFLQIIHFSVPEYPAFSRFLTILLWVTFVCAFCIVLRKMHFFKSIITPFLHLGGRAVVHPNCITGYMMLTIRVSTLPNEVRWSLLNTY